jgi:hypothetical protein
MTQVIQIVLHTGETVVGYTIDGVPFHDYGKVSRTTLKMLSLHTRANAETRFVECRQGTHMTNNAYCEKFKECVANV